MGLHQTPNGRESITTALLILDPRQGEARQQPTKSIQCKQPDFFVSFVDDSMVGGWVRRLSQNVSRLFEYDTTDVELLTKRRKKRNIVELEQIVNKLCFYYLPNAVGRTDGRTEFYCLVRPIITNRQWIMAG